MNEPRALLIDAGNSRLKWGVLSDGQLKTTGSIDNDKLHQTGFAALTARIPTSIERVLISNVAGQGLATKLSSVIGLHCGVDAHFARCQKSAFGLVCGYRQPRRLGVDRWVGMVGAWAEFKRALVVVDAGTAMTIDAIDKAGNHLGGHIIPGMRLMGESLQAKTSDIAPAGRTRKKPGSELNLFGRTTADAIVFGSVSAAAGAIEFAAKRMRASGLRPNIVLTGGDASRILEQLSSGAISRPNLVLQGLSKMVMDGT